MSIASQITALTTDRNAIRAALVNQGVSAAVNHGFDDFAADINNLNPIPAITETQDSHGGTILDIRAIDYTSDTVAPDKLLYGYTAHDSTGTAITGTYVEPVIPIIENDVIFIDYDGTLLYSYTAAEFASLTELPANPTHTGLTAQGWNWSLSDAKTYVAAYGKLTIGQNYATSNDHTRLYISITDVELLSFRLGILVSSGTVTVDWGDNSPQSSTTVLNANFLDHTYSAIGDYIIDISSSNESRYSLDGYTNNGYAPIFQPPTSDISDIGSISANLCVPYMEMLKKVELSSYVLHIRCYSYYGASNLETITCPNTLQYIDEYAFDRCSKLKAFVVPTGLNTNYKKIYNHAFYACTSLKRVSIPHDIQGIYNYAFYQCSNLSRIEIPDSCEFINDYAFQYADIREIIFPSSITKFAGYAFANSNVEKVKLNGPLTNLLDTYVFYYALSLISADLSLLGRNSLNYDIFYGCNNLKEVILPNGLIEIDSDAFYQCYALSKIDIPSTVQTIESRAFGLCTSLRKIVIPSSVTSIGTSAFTNCNSLREVHFLSTTPPTLGGSNVFTYISSYCKFYVPSGSLSAYTSATNYPSSSTYTYIEE